MYQQLIKDFVEQEALPASYAADAQRWFAPLVEIIRSECEARAASESGHSPLLVGINGTQGSGKSTLASLLQKLLTEQKLIVASLSIDDFYLSKAKRLELAQSIHPLLSSRGVPGTHNTHQLEAKLTELATATTAQTTSLPDFDKATDDCLPEQDWQLIQGRPDIVFLEGWFVGVQPQEENALAEPINSLEQEEDKNGHWRRWVNQQLAGAYQDIFGKLDLLVLLEAPSFELVYEWRSLQEAKLRDKRGSTEAIMDDAGLKRFIEHFERLTRHCLETLPGKADLVYQLDRQHRVTGLIDNRHKDN